MSCIPLTCVTGHRAIRSTTMTSLSKACAALARMGIGGNVTCVDDSAYSVLVDGRRSRLHPDSQYMPDIVMLTGIGTILLFHASRSCITCVADHRMPCCSPSIIWHRHPKSPINCHISVRCCEQGTARRHTRHDGIFVVML